MMSGVIEPASDDELAEALAEAHVNSVDDLPAAPVAPEGRGSLPPRQPMARQDVSVETLVQLLDLFDAHLKIARVDLDIAARLDVISAVLSSQFVLFAGPSGTGKSTVARVLQTFFAPLDSRAVIECRRQLIGPEDIAGYPSPLSGSFVEGTDLQSLLRLARPSDSVPCPILLVEEVNLSPPEGYLSPFIHGLSSPSTREVDWRLHAGKGDVQTELPSELRFVPFPRLLGTINVDSTASAPAKKVSARACVVLMEPVDVSTLDDVWHALAKPEPNVGGFDSDGAPFLGDPLLAVRLPGVDPIPIQNECLRLAAAIEQGPTVFNADWSSSANPVRTVSRRQVAQMVGFSAWFSLIARAQDARVGSATPLPERIAAENALLHFVLPNLDATTFGQALRLLSDSKPHLSVPTQSQYGGLLRARVDRLESAGGEQALLGQILDFWDRLS